MKNGNGSRRADARPILVTGGSGFVGCNIADALATRGDSVLVFDSLARDGVRDNARWLKSRHGSHIEICTADIRDTDAVVAAVSRSSAVLHLAGQVAVTCSLDEPVDDFEVNARGTLNVLESVRLHNPEAPLIFASTNKVYGRLLADAAITKQDGRYVPIDTRLAQGVAEDAPLDLYSPYGCSKGTADQYVHDYARVFGLRTAVLRMSCIYGPRQFGTEDQGWIAHFLLQAIRGAPITIYGSGLQVRDALHVTDAATAWLGVLDHIDAVAGRVFNLGGGRDNSVSLTELVDLIAELRGSMPKLKFADWRPGDQPWYVSDIRAISKSIQWHPRMRLRDGLHTLNEWLSSRREVVPLVPSLDETPLEQEARA
jgi:CDP-paratose 2-epimerase